MEIKFKAGDSVQIPDGCTTKIENGLVVFEKEQPKFKSGDFITLKKGEDICYGIVDKVILNKYNTIHIDCKHCILSHEGVVTSNTFNSGYYESIFISTPEEKQLLIDKLHEAGKDWDSEKLEVVDWVWKPKVGDDVWRIDKYKIEVCSYLFEEDYHNLDLLDFRTRELAEEALEMLKKCKHY